MEWEGGKSDRYALVTICFRDGDREHYDDVIFSKDTFVSKDHIELMQMMYGGVSDDPVDGGVGGSPYEEYWHDGMNAVSIYLVRYLTKQEAETLKKFNVAVDLGAESWQGVSLAGGVDEIEEMLKRRFESDFDDVHYIVTNVMTPDQLEEEYGDYMRDENIRFGQLAERLDNRGRIIEEAEYLREKYYPPTKENEMDCDSCGAKFTKGRRYGREVFCRNCVSEYSEDFQDVPDETFEALPYGNLYGACLLPDGSCMETSLDTCNLMGGRFQGPGTSCNPDDNYLRPRVMRSETTNQQGKGLSDVALAIIVGVATGVATTIFGNVLSEMWLDRLREDPELHTTPDELDPQ